MTQNRYFLIDLAIEVIEHIYVNLDVKSFTKNLLKWDHVKYHSKHYYLCKI